MVRSRARGPRDAKGSEALADRLRALGNEVTALHFRLIAALERVHGPGAFSYGGRALLRNLVELGPRTVPELARMRPVSRQYVQQLVDDLAARRLVSFEDNPAHRRSKLVRATAEGRRTLASMLRREASLLARIARGLDPLDVERALALLRAARERTDRALAAPRRNPAETRPKRRAGRRRDRADRI